jgi:hypothetical protein
MKVHDDQSVMKKTGSTPLKYSPTVLVSTLLGSWPIRSRATSLSEDVNSEERAILCESGARPGVYDLLVRCCAMSLFERSWISSDGASEVA